MARKEFTFESVFYIDFFSLQQNDIPLTKGDE